MFVQRLRGLVNLHVVLTTCMAMLLLLAYASAAEEFPWLAKRLNPGLSMLPYLLCVGVGMILSASHVRRLAGSFHRLSWAEAAWLAARQITLVALLVFVFMFAFKDRNMSRVFMGSYLVSCWFVLVLVNHALPRTLSRIFFEQSRRVPTLFIGSSASLQRLKGWLAAKEVLGMHPVGLLSGDGVPDETTNPPFLGHSDGLAQVIDETGAGQVVMLELPKSQLEGSKVIEACQDRGARLLIYSNLAEQLRHPLVTVTEEGRQFYTLQEEPLEDPFNRLLKRLFDIALSLPVVVLVLPPLILLVWIMQSLQAPGPVIFAQPRTGYGKQRFRLLKFRSMRAAPRDASAEAQQASKGDARIYPFGQFLRRTSLDEFPQFWNVLMGHMSAVGPRPHPVELDAMFEKQISGYRTRFYVKSGITGLAQCNGYRGEITESALLQQRIAYDLEYISNWSIWMDIQIAAKSLGQIVFPPKSAY
jgi:exopolysaccharide biosynthesis polyprenyl glycosylphosphotransferase